MARLLGITYQELEILPKYFYISNMEDGVDILITKKLSTAVINDQITNMEAWVLPPQVRQPTVKGFCLIIRKITSKIGKKFI